jgi:indolepyruvate ferredoxin oxidoreductase
VTGAALYRALELFGVNVAQNKLAFDWGRFTAHDPAEVETLAGSEKFAEPSSAIADVVDYRERFLESYQDRAYAERYADRISRIGAVEARVRPGSTSLADAVARNYFKLLAYKDEYEVARLYTDTGFVDSLRRNFGQKFKLRFHMSPPLLSRIDTDTGRPRKYEFGGWMLIVLRLLARAKRLRGTRFDLFGYSRERRTERRLICEYERTLDRIEKELDDGRFDVALELAALPGAVRGFGPIKLAAVERYEDARLELLDRWATATRTGTLTESGEQVAPRVLHGASARS